nr:ABC transporter permease [Exilispira sp.]
MKLSRNTLFTILSLIVFAIGLTLYLGEYFIGLLFILGSIMIYSLSSYFSNNRESFIELLKSKAKTIVYPFIGIFVALILGGIIMFISGYNPFEAYAALFYGAFYKNWSTSVINAVPLIFTGLITDVLQF